jgi:hypothetical protein
MLKEILIEHRGVTYRFSGKLPIDERVEALCDDNESVFEGGRKTLRVIVPDVGDNADIMDWFFEEQLALLSCRIDARDLPEGHRQSSARLENCSEKAGYSYWWQLAELSRDEHLRYKYFGRKSVAEMRKTLMAVGLDLGMRVLIDRLRDQLPEPDSGEE